MGILNWLKRKKKTKKKYSDDEYIRSQLIHTDYLTDEKYPKYYILFTFSNSYCQSVIDVVNYLESKVIYIPSSDDIDTGEVDEDGYEIINSTPKNYLLIKVSHIDVSNLMLNIDIANPFVSEIIQQMYDHGDKSNFTDFIHDGIMNESLFINENVSKNKNMITYDRVTYNDIEVILKLLPSEFTGMDLAEIFDFKLINNTYPTTSLLIGYISVKFPYLTDDEIAHIYKGVLKNPTKDNLQKLLLPKYKRSIDEDELIHGDLSSNDVDEIFKEQYDRFSAVKNDNTTYMDIDEALSEDDPEYNDLQSDDVEEY